MFPGLLRSIRTCLVPRRTKILVISWLSRRSNFTKTASPSIKKTGRKAGRFPARPHFPGLSCFRKDMNTTCIESLQIHASWFVTHGVSSIIYFVCLPAANNNFVHFAEGPLGEYNLFCHFVLSYKQRGYSCPNLHRAICRRSTLSILHSRSIQ